MLLRITATKTAQRFSKNARPAGRRRYVVSACRAMQLSPLYLQKREGADVEEEKRSPQKATTRPEKEALTCRRGQRWEREHQHRCDVQGLLSAHGAPANLPGPGGPWSSEAETARARETETSAVTASVPTPWALT